MRKIETISFAGIFGQKVRMAFLPHLSLLLYLYPIAVACHGLPDEEKVKILDGSKLITVLNLVNAAVIGLVESLNISFCKTEGLYYENCYPFIPKQWHL